MPTSGGRVFGAFVFEAMAFLRLAPFAKGGILAALPMPLPRDMDRKLLDILACPASRQPLGMLEARGLQALNAAIAAGGIARVDGQPQADALREALITRDRKLVYRIDDGIPVLLVEEGIAAGQVPDFPHA